jgi:hypothetical protein
MAPLGQLIKLETSVSRIVFDRRTRSGPLFGPAASRARAHDFST